MTSLLPARPPARPSSSFRGSGHSTVRTVLTISAFRQMRYRGPGAPLASANLSRLKQQIARWGSVEYIQHTLGAFGVTFRLRNQFPPSIHVAPPGSSETTC